jgi:hypothetical protein
MQGGIVRAVSVLSDSLGNFTLTAGVQSSVQLSHVPPEGCRSTQAYDSSQANAAGESVAFHRSMLPTILLTMLQKQNVSFCHGSARHDSGQELRMGRFSRGVR